MKCVILAAGYATRLYPLTESFPKPLLTVKGKPILDWLIEDIGDAVDRFIVVSNHRFAEHFNTWAKQHKENIVVLDDGTESAETRLGAVKDIQFAIETLELSDDLLVIAGDNLLDFSLRSFITYFQQKQTTCIMRYWEENEAMLHKTGVAMVDEQDRIVHMEEKPAEPKSHWCVPPFYVYKASDVGWVKIGIEAGSETDTPGSIIAWLSKQTVIHAYEMPGKRYDIGNLESYRLVLETYKGMTSQTNTCPV